MCYFCVLFLTEINQEMIEDIKKACQVMNEGGVILYPTDTVWGIDRYLPIADADGLPSTVDDIFFAVSSLRRLLYVPTLT